jgi:small subunit ribosomal protein S9
MTKKEEKNNFIKAIGRRKTAVATVLFYPKEKGEITINGKSLSSYFPQPFLQKTLLSPFEAVNLEPSLKVEVRVSGGGKVSQAEAIRHGISKALSLHSDSFRAIFKKLGFLTRDPRMKERKKFGLKRARRAPQWQKR